MRAINSTLAGLAGAVLVLTSGTWGLAAQAPSVGIQPDRLERGPDIAIPHLEGKTVVDGDVRIRVRAGFVTLLGQSAGGYVIGTANADHQKPRLWRYSPDGSRTLLLRGHYAQDSELSDDGAVLAAARSFRPTSVTVVDTGTARTVAQRAFPGVVQVLDVDGDRVALGTDRNSRVWNTTRNRVRTVQKMAGYRADLSSNLLASFTKDPYWGGCTRLTRFTDPRKVLWTSCTERIDAFSPDGRRLGTVGLLSDGIGPGEVWQRTVRGTLISRYTTSWFGPFGWESPDTMLLEANGKRKRSVVRCRLGSCENATDPQDLRDP
jgi:WD40 repeat protein